MKPIEAIQRAISLSRENIKACKEAIAENKSQIDRWTDEICREQENIVDGEQALRLLGVRDSQ